MTKELKTHISDGFVLLHEHLGKVFKHSSDDIFLLSVLLSVGANNLLEAAWEELKTLKESGDDNLQLSLLPSVDKVLAFWGETAFLGVLNFFVKFSDKVLSDRFHDEQSSRMVFSIKNVCHHAKCALPGSDCDHRDVIEDLILRNDIAHGMHQDIKMSCKNGFINHARCGLKCFGHEHET